MAVGVDVGSTTVKVVVSRDGAIVHRAYARHQGRCRETAERMLAEAKGVGPIRVTGSAGSALAEGLGGTYVHEVHAIARAVKTRIPEARTAIELGGQDAKMIHFADDGSFASDMNERCAAGTGATLDRCLHRIGFDVRSLADFVLPDAELPVVSAKCGVFAESDLVGLVKAGVARELAVGGLLDAIVRGNLAVLARGRPLPPGIILLGGPHAFVPALAVLWRRHLQARWREHAIASGDVVVPEHAAYFAAEGALDVERSVRRLSLVQSSTARCFGPPLVDDHRFDPTETALHPRPHGELALGIDAGSTTIKAVVLDERDVVAHRVYRKSALGPLEDARAVFASLARALGDRHVTSFGVTGYAADVLGPVFGADAAPVETLAHARAALRWVPDADVVCDVGGQDIKVLVLEHGAVRDFRLSHQCAAGNGALLEAAARDLGVPLDGYAEVAFQAKRTPELAIGCAVFLDSERVTCQRDGFTPAEILAGFARVLPRNIWENVVAAPSLESLGRVFVLSGGVQLNRAALRAQIEYLEARHPSARIVVHPHAAIAGAIGAAIVAREKRVGRSRFVGFERATAMRFIARNDASTRCRACPSACARTIIEAEAARFVTGHGCERGADAGVVSSRGAARNLVRVEARRLFENGVTQRVSSAGRGRRVAIPRVLGMYRSAPLFLAYFGAIGAEVVTSEPSTEQLWQRAAGRGTVDACFPVKIAHAHVADLLQRREPFVFHPVLTHAVTKVRGCADSASCPVVAGTPLVAKAAFGDPALVTPTLVLTRPALFEEQLWDAMHPIFPDLTRDAHRAAIDIARATQRDFEASLERDGRAALERASAEKRCALVLLGRPYHADPGIHHDIASELWALGRTTMTIRALPKDRPELDLADVAPELTNSGDGEKLAAARMVAANRHVVAIEISSFKCGQDAALYGAVADLARTGGKPFLALHDLDETRPVASLRLRLRTFLDAVERWERA